MRQRFEQRAGKHAEEQHRGQGTRTECQHDQCCHERVAADHCQAEGAVNKAAGQQPPQAAEQQRITGAMHRQQALHESGHMPPQFAAPGFQAVQTVDPQRNLQAHRTHHHGGGNTQYHTPDRMLRLCAQKWQQTAKDHPQHGVT